MKIRFNPPQVENAQSAELLTRLVQEMAPEVCGELRVLQNSRGEPSRLVLISPGLAPVSQEVPHGWLYLPLTEEAIGNRLAALFQRLPAGAVAGDALSAAA